MSLFLKIFLSFGVAMAATLVATVYISFQFAQGAFDPVRIEQHDPMVNEAAIALADRGERGLRNWLAENTRQESGLILLIVDDRGEELLDRALPGEMRRLLRFSGPGPGDGMGFGGGDRSMGPPSPERERESGRQPPSNLRPAQLTPHLVGDDGDEYRLLFVRPPVAVFGMLAWPGSRAAIGAVALLIAALTSLMLARYISAPIARLRRASRDLAKGQLDTRVGAPKRGWATDEVGVLSRDFDTMAERIQALVTDKETLLRDISHELRSPLARIRMALGLAERKANDEVQPDLDRIEQEAERLDALIGQIMTLARLRTQQEPVREPVRMDVLVRGIVDDARYEHPDATVNYRSPDGIEVFGDPRGIASAVENVVRNALAYAGEAGPIDVDITDEAGDVIITVRDSGPGVLPEELPRIFEPMYRADQSRDHGAAPSGSAGQGIGLAITARVMELHGGEATASNRAGGGLKVTLRLPTGADERA